MNFFGKSYKIDHDRESSRLDKLPDVVRDLRPNDTGVLLSDAIKFYVSSGKMISPFNEKNLKPAEYELTVGDQAMKGGEFVRLEGVDSELNIPPFEVVVVKTAETINLPRFLIARWNIRVTWAYKGLLWVGGPQVDPGFVGHLFCPLYNLSNENVKLRKGEAIAVMDFVKTTTIQNESDLDNGNLVRYRRPPKRVLIMDYPIKGFRSALYAKDVDVRDGLRQLQTRVDVFSSLVFVVLAIMVAAVSLPYVTGGSGRINGDTSFAFPLVFSFAAFLFALFSAWSSRRGRTVFWML